MLLIESSDLIYVAFLKQMNTSIGARELLIGIFMV